MDLAFRKPVYTGEEITCRSTTGAVTEREDRYEVTFDVVCENEDGEAVLRATIDGLIFTDG
jgi:acyl dehydratase